MGITKNGSESRCHFTQFENGKVTTRWISEMVLQLPDGKVVTLKGAQLPDAIQLYSASPEEGNALTVLLRKPSGPSMRSFATDFLNGTRARDIVFMVVGSFFCISLLAVFEGLLRILNT